MTMKTHSLILPASALVVAILLFQPTWADADEAKVGVASVIDKRQSPDRMSDGTLYLGLKIAADEAIQARNFSVVVSSATDETGQSLSRFSSSEPSWENILVRQREDKRSVFASVELSNPARSAKTLREVTGTIEFYEPARDSQSVVTIADIAGQAGKFLTNPTLEELGLKVIFLNKAQLERYKQSEADRLKPLEGPVRLSSEVELQSVKEFARLFWNISVAQKSLAFHITDPHGRLVDIEIATGNGQSIKHAGWSTSYMKGGRTKTYEFTEKIPENAQIKIYVATLKSVTKIPFELTDVRLP